MTNYLIIFLIITTLSSCCLYFSWKYYKEAKYAFAVLFIMLCGLSLRIFTGSDGFLHEWDERYHALVAKNLLTNPTIPTLYSNPVLPFDYRDWTANNVWVHKQPVPLYTISLSLLIFGINEISVRLPSIIFSTLGIWLTFYIGAFFFNKKIGFLSAFFYSINGLIIELSAGRVATDHIDIFFLFFVQLSIYLTIKYIETKSFILNILSALSLGFGILSKWLPALIVLPIWCLLVINSGKFSIRKTAYDFIGFIIVAAIVVIPWQIYINSFFPMESKWEASFNLKHITEVLDNQGGPVYYYLNKIRINYGELIYLPVIYFLIKFFKDIKNLKLLSLLIWFGIPILFFSFVQTKMQGYILFTSPSLFIVTSFFYYKLKEYKFINKISSLLQKLILLLIIILPIRYSIERIKPLEFFKRQPEWVLDLKKINDKYNGKTVLFNYEKPIEAMFYTNFIVYSYIPDTNKIKELISSGYNVLIKEKNDIPSEIRNIKGVVFIGENLVQKTVNNFLVYSNDSLRNNKSNSDTILIAAVGDLMCHMKEASVSRVQGGYDFFPLFEYVEPYISKADISIANLETVLAGEEKGFSGFPLFNSPDEFCEAAAKCGFNVLTTANNHCIDKGIKGLERTIDIINQNGVFQTGTFKTEEESRDVLILNAKGIKVAILAYTYGVNGLYIPKDKKYSVNLIDFEKIESDIEEAKSRNADKIIVSIHWGEEYQRYPNKYQKAIADKIFSAGADIILGSHPHVLQGTDMPEYEDINGNTKKKFIIYSMGNFIANQFNAHTRSGVILYIKLVKNHSTNKTEILKVSFEPTYIAKGSLVVLPVKEATEVIEQKDNSSGLYRFKGITGDLKSTYQETKKHLQNEDKNIFIVE